MSDEIDLISDRQAKELAAVSALRAQAIREKTHYHNCRYCFAPTVNGNPFCDKDCADDFGKQAKLHKIKGY